MSFDFSTLVTDRTQSDVQNGTKKGYYNAEDLNRVTACMDYLNEVLTRLGYETGYQRIVVHNPPQSFPVILSVNTAVVGTV